MARPTKQPLPKVAGFDQHLRCSFLAYSQNSPALQQLATLVRSGEMSLATWAEKFGVSKTWVERWAQDALDSWRRSLPANPVVGQEPRFWFRLPPRQWHDAIRPYEPGTLPLLGQSGSGELDLVFPLPRDEPPSLICTDDREWAAVGQMFSEDPNAIMSRSTAARQQGQARKRMDHEAQTLEEKVKYAAIYLMHGKTIEEVAHLRPITVSAMYTWLKDALAALKLKMRPRGHRASENHRTVV